MIVMYSRVWHVRRSGKEHFESKNVQILVMKYVSEMQFMRVHDSQVTWSFSSRFKKSVPGLWGIL